MIDLTSIVVRQKTFAYGGVDIIEDANLTRMVEDWTKVRSPGRARRRRRRGFPQKIEVRTEPDPTIYMIEGRLVMHPETLRKVQARIAEKVTKGIESDMMSVLMGGSVL